MAGRKNRTFNQETMRDFKRDFKKWYNDVYVIVHKYPSCMKPYALGSFYNDTPPEQWGVMVDFFDSVGIIINCEYNIVLGDFRHHILIHDKKHWIKTDGQITRPEAREKALEEAEKIYEQLEPKPINLD